MDNRDNKGRFVKGHKPYKGGGRLPKIQSIPDILREIGGEEGSTDGKTKLESVLRKVYIEAKNGKSWAINFIADRTEGKPKETIEQIDTDQIQEIKMI